jgi:hypothetical protein
MSSYLVRMVLRVERGMGNVKRLEFDTLPRELHAYLENAILLPEGPTCPQWPKFPNSPKRHLLMLSPQTSPFHYSSCTAMFNCQISFALVELTV